MSADQIVAFLRACLDEDQATAEAAPAGPWKAAPGDGPTAWRVLGGFTTRERFNSATDTREITTHREEIAGPDLGAGGVRSESAAVHMARHDPQRVLAEVDARRRILARYEDLREQVRHPVSAEARAACRIAQGELEDVLRLLVLPYTDHPDCPPDVVRP